MFIKNFIAEMFCTYISNTLSIGNIDQKKAIYCCNNNKNIYISAA